MFGSESRLLFRLLLCFSLFPALPVKAYWQQHTITKIFVTLDDRKHFLHGFEEITYTNHSPDTLHYIFIHLWPNAYKNDRTAFCEQMVQQGKTDFYFSKESEKGYIDSLHFSVNGTGIAYQNVGNNPDVARIDLPEPLVPGAAVSIETPFRVKIPKVFSRLGHNKQAYFISQWFPKPAVYDHTGWHPMPYLDQGEFYSEFGSYDVSITLPANYRLLATGNCLTDTENEWMDSLSRLPLPADTLYNKTFPHSDEQYKTVRYKEEHIHDFAWFADKRWVLRRDTLSTVEDSVKTIAIAFLPCDQKEWSESIPILKKTLMEYGKMVGPYPYRSLKAVEGDMLAGSAMEYPTIAIISKDESSELPALLVHEAGHNWFYGMLGSNERDFPWMDEGLNTFYERKALQSYGQDKRNFLSDQDEQMLHFSLQSFNEDQPVGLPATAYRPVNYGSDVYYKTSALMEWLEQYMGPAAFHEGMRDYFETWKFKHPYPDDFRAALQRHSDKKLDWFFDSVFHSAQRTELKLIKAKNAGDGVTVGLKNKSNFRIPAAVSVLRNDTVLKTIWTEPFARTATLTVPGVAGWDKVRLSATAADYKLANNQYDRHALFHKWSVRIRPGSGLSRNLHHVLYLSPAAGYNAYDGFGAGILLHNLNLPQHRFQFAAAPLYSIGSNTINGAAAFAYSWYPSKVFKEIRLQQNVKTFAQGSTDLNISKPLYARYFKIAPALELVFKEKDLLSNVRQTVLVKQYIIEEQSFGYARNFAVDSLFRPYLKINRNVHLLLRYTYTNKKTFHPYAYSLESQFGKDFIKLNLEGNLRIDYDMQDKSLFIRGYAGKFIATGNGAAFSNSRYWLNTNFSGTNDYLLDGTYFGRNENEGLFSRQVSLQEGGGKMPTNLYANPLGRSDNWLLALNLKTDLPFGKLPLRLYADVSTFADARFINPSGNRLLFNAGLELHLFKELLSIYAPLLMSTDYSDYFSSIHPENTLLNRIAFSLNVQNLNFLRGHEFLFRRMAE